MIERWIVRDRTGAAVVVLPTTRSRTNGVCVEEVRTPPPAPRNQWIPVPEGQLPSTRDYENREITMRIALERPTDEWAGTTHAFPARPPEAGTVGNLPGWRATARLAATDGTSLAPMISDLQAIVSLLQRNGGTLERQIAIDAGTARVTFDVHTASDPNGATWDELYLHDDETTIELTFTCAPFGRGAETALTGPGGTTYADLAAGQRFAVFNGLDVPGDVEALTRVEVTSLGSRDRDSVLVAIDRPDTVVAALGVQVPANNRRLPPAATTSAPVATGALSVSTVKLGALAAGRPAGVWEPCAYLETSGAPMPLSGSFRMLARVAVGGWAPTATTRGSLRLRLRWADGSAAVLQTNPEQVLVADGQFQLVDLGIVQGGPEARMRGVIERTGDTGATLEIDTLHPIPIDVHAVGAASLAPPTMTLAAIDDWSTGPTTLNGRTSTGGTGAWAVQGTASGSTWTINTAISATEHTAGGLQAATVPAPASQARYRVSALVSGLSIVGGPDGVIIGNTAGIAWMVSGGTRNPTDWAAYAWISNASGGMVMCSVYGFGPGMTPGLLAREITADAGGFLAAARINLEVSTRGVSCWLGSASTSTTAEFELPGLVGANPRVGILAGSSTKVAHTQFVALSTVSDLDHALYAGKTTRIASTVASRVDAAGDRAAMARYGGDRPKLLPSSFDGRKSRVTVGAMSGGGVTGQPDVAPNEALRVQVFATPRWLQIPDISQP